MATESNHALIVEPHLGPLVYESRKDTFLLLFIAVGLFLVGGAGFYSTIMDLTGWRPLQEPELRAVFYATTPLPFIAGVLVLVVARRKRQTCFQVHENGFAFSRRRGFLAGGPLHTESFPWSELNDVCFFRLGGDAKSVQHVALTFSDGRTFLFDSNAYQAWDVIRLGVQALIELSKHGKTLSPQASKHMGSQIILLDDLGIEWGTAGDPQERARTPWSEVERLAVDGRGYVRILNRERFLQTWVHVTRFRGFGDFANAFEAKTGQKVQLKWIDTTQEKE
jgi:hypothetical protein